MAVYWLLWAIPLVALLMPTRLSARDVRWAWMLVWFIFTIAIGLRYAVGGDWYVYLDHLDLAYSQPLSEAMRFSDPGYQLLNWAASRLDAGIYLVNTICAAIVMIGIVVFARRQPMPWLALLVAVPYTIVVVAMGYTRQSVALGFELLALTALADGHTRRFVLLIVLGALFHKSAALLLPIAALSASRNRIWVGVWVLIVTAGMYFFLVLEYAEALWTSYIEQRMESEGGIIRVAMNTVPALLFLLFRRKLTQEAQDRQLWTWIALLALLCVPLVGSASTAVDRLALYLVPIQMYVFARLHRVAREQSARAPIVIGVVAYYAAVQWVWLNHASHAQYWLPYRFAPLT